jgi:hypothetical protein
MNDTVITSEPPANTTSKTKKRKMSAAGKKALSDKLKARWAERKALPEVANGIDELRALHAIAAGQALPAPVVPAAPVPPSPAVLALQSQVVELVSQRNDSRSRLTESHAAYLLAQSKFQAAEGELKGIEQEVQYRIGLIAQLENRPAAMANPLYATPAPLMQIPQSLGSISSEPAQAPQPQNRTNEQFAVGFADELRRGIGGMM